MANLRATAPLLGFMPRATSFSNPDFLLNTADGRFLARYYSGAGGNLSSLSHWFGSIGGSPTFEATVYALGTNGLPTGAALDTSGSTAIADGRNTFTGWAGAALAAGTYYGVVFRNNHATPASNNARPVVCVSLGIPGNGFGYSQANSWATHTSTDAGANWSALSAGSTSLVVNYTDGTSIGYPYAGTWNGGVSEGIYAGRQLGLRLTTPPIPLRALGVWADFNGNTGSPTGRPLGRIRQVSGDTVLAESTAPAIAAGSEFPFSSPVVLPPSLDIRVVIGETTQSDTSGNRYNLRGHTIPASNPTIPWGARFTYYDGTSWAETTTRLVMCGLIFDDQPCHELWAPQKRFNRGWN